MQRHHGVSTLPKSKTGRQTKRARMWQLTQERVDHDISDEPNALRCDTFGEEVCQVVTRCCEQQIAHPVSQHAVYLLRHAPVSAPEPGFDVSGPTPIMFL